MTVGFSQFIMGAAKKPSGFAGRGCDERSCPSFLSGPDWGKCDERPRGLVRAGPTGSRPSFFQAPRGTESVHDGASHATIRPLCAETRALRVSLSPLRLVGLAVGCRLAANAGLAALPCRDYAAAVRTSAPGESSNSFGDSVCPCRALAGSRRWAIISSVSGGLEVTSGMRASEKT